MDRNLSTIAIRLENDVVLARQRARYIASLLGFDSHDQVRIATAVSEITRNAFRYARRGKTQFFVQAEPARTALGVRVMDEGPGIPNLDEILQGRYVSQTGMGMGILGARRLMDEFTIHSSPAGTRVEMLKSLPRRAAPLTPADLGEIAGQIARQAPQDAYEEVQRQNQELLTTLAEVQRQRTELAQLNKELEDTNRGVVALYAELDERADYLRRASELKSQFLSNMTHEFRTPLNSILSLGRILLDGVDGSLNPEQERQVRYIQKGAEDLSELVNDLLDLAKVEAGKVSIRPAEFIIEDLFGALRGMLRPLLAHNSAVSLVFEEPVDVHPLVTDETKVSQILRNLLSNALKYTERGEIRVRAYRERPDHVVFSVSDTGIGIALADHERVFEEFAQVEGGHQKGKAGTGLGLPLSRKLAQLLGGTLHVESELGHGSTFSLRIPIHYRGEPEVSFVPEVSNELDPTRLPILVLEDNRETLFAYEKYLKGTGYQPIPARNLKQARAALQQFRPAAIMLDILLGRENSWDFLAELKQSSATRQIPVLVVTQVENEHKALALGADAFHPKPLERSWLLNRLQRLAPRNPADLALVVDDDDASRYILAGFLSGTRFRVVEARNGREALALAKARRPAVIFLDLVMPGPDGFQVLDQLKADQQTTEIPVVIHTSKALSAAERSRLQGRVLAVLPKNHQDRAASARAFREVLGSVQNQPHIETPSHA